LARRTNTPNIYSDDEVNYDGGVGFLRMVDRLTLVTLKDTNGTVHKHGRTTRAHLAPCDRVECGFKGIDLLTLKSGAASIQSTGNRFGR